MPSAGTENVPAPAHDDCAVVELRQYSLHPGTRDRFIELFDREFVESQEALGSWVIGQFRDLDDPDRIVWLRGFRDMPARGKALTAFYGGSVWQAHRDAANAAIIAPRTDGHLRSMRASNRASRQRRAASWSRRSTTSMRRSTTNSWRSSSERSNRHCLRPGFACGLVW
jgi:hypothetical protein